MEIELTRFKDHQCGLQSIRWMPSLIWARGVATGGISVYILPKISNRFVHVWDINTCFEIAITS